MMINPSYPTREPVQSVVKGDSTRDTTNARPRQFVDLLNDVHREGAAPPPPAIQPPSTPESEEATESEEIAVPDEHPSPADTEEGTEENEAVESSSTVSPSLVVAIPDVPEVKKEAVPVTLPTPTRNTNSSVAMGTATITSETADSYTPVPSTNGAPDVNTEPETNLTTRQATGPGLETTEVIPKDSTAVGDSVLVDEPPVATSRPSPVDLRQDSPVPGEINLSDGEITVVSHSGQNSTAETPKNMTTEGEELHTATTSTGEAVDTDAPDPSRPLQLSERQFPRTLNALFAEHAVRARQSTPSSVQRLVEELTEAPEAAPTKSAVDESAPPGATPASPTTALESGGVRLTATQGTPRIPLANLPGEIAQQIHRIQQEGSTTLHLRISPKHLGDLRLEVHRKGDTIRVTMVSSNPQVREALESQLSDLRRALSEQGLNLSDASVEDGSSPRDGQESFSRQTTEHGHRNGHTDRHQSETTETIRTALRESPRITSDSINVLA